MRNIILIIICLFLCACASKAPVVKNVSCGKIMLNPIPEEEMPSFKTIKPGGSLPTQQSGGVYFPKSSYTLIEFYIKSLKAWAMETEAQVLDHNVCVDKQIKEIVPKKKGWW